MAKRKPKGAKTLAFRNKLVLNQWLVSLFGIDPFLEHKVDGRVVRPFHKLAEPIRDPRLEGLDKDNLHFFFIISETAPCSAMPIHWRIFPAFESAVRC